MGDPRSAKKKYGTPKKPWDKKLLETEKSLRQLYGLRNKREIRSMEATLRAKRRNAKNVLALPLEKRAAKEKELLDSLTRMGVMRGKPSLQDVLSLSLESFLERRLQTIVWRKNLANSPKQARQFITHGHISINGTKVTVPSYFVTKDEEVTIAYHGKPMLLQNPQQKQKDDKQLAKDFAQMRGEPQGTEGKLTGEEEENTLNPDAAEAAQEAEEGKGFTMADKDNKVGLVHIFATHNNTIILLTDLTGAETLAKCSGGVVVKTQHKEGSPYAAMKIAETIAQKAREKGISTVHVRVRAKGGIRPRNPGQGAEAAIRSLTRNGMRIISIENVTPTPHDGTRKKKKHRSKKV